MTQFAHGFCLSHFIFLFLQDKHDIGILLLVFFILESADDEEEEEEFLLAVLVSIFLILLELSILFSESFVDDIELLFLETDVLLLELVVEFGEGFEFGEEFEFGEFDKFVLIPDMMEWNEIKEEREIEKIKNRKKNQYNLRI